MYKLKVENTNVEVDLEIDNKQWEEAVEKVYQTTKNKYPVEGFRKGKAPRRVIEKNYGDGVFFDDALNNLIEDTLTEVMEKNPEYEPVVMPKTELQSFKPEEGLKIKITFEIVPDFKICKYTGQTFKVPDTKVDDKEIEHEIHHLLLDNSTFETVDRPIKDTDSAVIDFVGFINDKEFEGGSAENYTLEIGSHTFIDNFEEQLIGHKKGEVVDVNVTFPENYHADEFKGQKALFKVTIKAVRERHLPELDDNLISNATEFETVEEYRKHVFAHIQTMKQEEQKNTFEIEMRDYLVENTQISLPQEMIDRNVQNEIVGMQNYAKQLNMPFEEFVLRMYGTEISELEKRITESVIYRTKIRYIYRKIIKENNIMLTEEEIKEGTKGIVDEHEIEHKVNDLLVDKLRKFLIENNKMEIDANQKLEF